MTAPSLTEMALAALYGRYDKTPLTHQEMSVIARRWHITPAFLAAFLGKSQSTARRYLYTSQELPGDASARIRRLDRVLAAIGEEPQ